VGRDLINAATIRSQITQIEKYNAAVNTFRGKYGYLPGDIPNPSAQQFGFAPRWINEGQGDGNGILEGVNAGGPNQSSPWLQGAGETVLFWMDLSTAGLIDGGFNSATATNPPASVALGSMGLYLPTAKIGSGNYLYVYSGGWQAAYNWDNFAPTYPTGDGHNYFGTIAYPGEENSGQIYGSLGITVVQAYNIDKKMDDGLPQSGNVIALYTAWYAPGWAPGISCGGACAFAPYTTPVPGSSTTCFDNNNTNGNTQQYSMAQNNGTGLNCGLSFKFQ
jgi:hypothetical protein